MKSFKAQFVTCLLLLVGMCLFAQSPTVTELPKILDIVPPSPEAAALGKYGDIPVGHYTGIPQISIPLGEAVSHEISVPISLSYHAGGHRVNEDATRVGLGWTLNAGGVITRTVRGLKDEANGSNEKGFLTLNSPSDLDCNSSTLLFEMAQGFQDSEPDAFHFNFLGHSGQFFFDMDGKIHFVTSNPLLKITHTLNGDDITAWQVIDESGNTYFFEAIERTTYAKSGPASITRFANSSWFLTKIISATGADFIEFDYQAGTHQSTFNVSETRLDLLLSTYEQGYGSPALDCEPIIFDESTQAIFIKTQQLSRIRTSLMEVEFLQGTPRQDLGSFTLGSIVFKTFPQKQKIKSHVFEYGHFYSSVGQTAGQALRYRLKLNKITELSWDPVTGSPQPKPAHEFFYNENIQLPPRDSKAQDHWGFFNGNGQDYNGKLIPPVTYNNQVYPGVNRDPNPQVLEACILTKITYPTGGFNEFIYEPHDYSSTGGNNVQFTPVIAGGLRIKKIITNDGNGQNPPLVNRFEYEISSTNPHVQTQYSSGRLVTPLILASEHKNWKSGNLSSSTGLFMEVLRCEYLKRSSSTQLPLATSQGSHVCYDLVTEMQEGNAGNSLGKTVYYFQSAGSFPDDQNGEPPYMSHVSHDWKRGQLLKKEIFDASGYPVQSQENFYSVITQSEVKKLSVSIKKDLVDGTKEYHCKAQNLVGGWVRLDSVVTRNYSQKDFDFIESKVTYSYNDVQQVRTTRNWENEVIAWVQEQYYPLDFDPANAPAFIQELQNHHILNVPIETVKRKEQGAHNDFLLSTFSTYHLKNTAENPSPTNLPKEIFVIRDQNASFQPACQNPQGGQPSSAYESRVSFNHYTPSGKLLEQQMTNDQPQAYIWHPEEGMLQAKVMNATQDAIAYSSFEENDISPEANGNWQVNDQPLILQDFKQGNLALHNSSNWERLQSHDGSNVSLQVQPASLGVYSCEIQLKNLKTGSANSLIFFNTISQSIQLAPGDYEVSIQVFDNQGNACTSYGCASVNYNYTNTSSTFNGFNHSQLAKTGYQAFLLNNNNSISKSQLPPGTYLLSFWQKGNVQVSAGGNASLSSAQAATPESDGWQRVQYILTISQRTDLVSLTGNQAYLDELRLHPSDAMMETVTYTPLRQAYQLIDVNMRIGNYEYDAFGRLKYVIDHEGNYLQGMDYNYKN